MATAFIVGNDGSVLLPTNHSLNVKVFAMNIAYSSQDVTGFAHTGHVRRLGLADITGSLNCSVTRDTGTPWGTITANALPTQPGGTLVLSLSGGTTTSGTAAALVQFDAVFSSFAFNSDKNGDASLTVNFEMNDSNGPTMVWTTV
jgi:hypothetical protein